MNETPQKIVIGHVRFYPDNPHVAGMVEVVGMGKFRIVRSGKQVQLRDAYGIKIPAHRMGADTKRAILTAWRHGVLDIIEAESAR